MANHIVSTCFFVTGLKDNDDVTKALQSLYDIFAAQGMGQATFELTGPVSKLWVKHPASVTPDPAVVDAALHRAGPYALADRPPESFDE